MDKSKLRSIIAVVAVALLVSMALPASADHDDKTGKVHKKGNDLKYTYINGAWIGDHMVICPGGLTVTVFPDGANSIHVVVRDPTNEANPPLVDETVPLPGGPYGPFPVPIPDTRICLGGATESTSGTTPPIITDNGMGSSTGYWEVWLHDFVYDLIKTATGGAIDIVPAAFARMVATASRSVTVKNPANCIPPGSSTRICPTTTTTETQTKVLTQFSVCGKAGVNGISTTAFDDLIAAKGTYDEYGLSKQVFVDGILFFLLDCGLGGTSLSPTYNDFVDWFNNDPANPPTGPFGGVPQVNPTCNPGIQGFSLCLFRLPTGDSVCWNAKYAAGHTAAGPGIIGTVGWSHDNIGNLNCLEPLNESPWLKRITSSTGVQIQHFPVDVDINP